MSACVLDTSAIIAYLNAEPGHDAVGDRLAEGAVVSAFNAQETVSKLVQSGVAPADARRIFLALQVDVHRVDFELAFEAGAMFPLTRSKGLGHGDRACLALASALSLPAVTGDRAWLDVADALGVRVESFR